MITKIFVLNFGFSVLSVTLLSLGVATFLVGLFFGSLVFKLAYDKKHQTDQSFFDDDQTFKTKIHILEQELMIINRRYNNIF